MSQKRCAQYKKMHYKTTMDMQPNFPPNAVINDGSVSFCASILRHASHINLRQFIVPVHTASGTSSKELSCPPPLALPLGDLSPISIAMPCPHCTHQRLNLSELTLSRLRSRLTTPILKYLSSPAAVLPPTYHFSAPIVSRQFAPSEELSLPLRLADPPPLCDVGVDMPPSCREEVVRYPGDAPGERERGGLCICCSAELVAPAFACAVIFLGVEAIFEAMVAEDVCVFCEEAGFIDEAWLPGTVRARKAEKKEAKKGLEGGCVGIVGFVVEYSVYSLRYEVVGKSSLYSETLS